MCVGLFFGECVSCSPGLALNLRSSAFIPTSDGIIGNYHHAGLCHAGDGRRSLEHGRRAVYQISHITVLTDHFGKLEEKGGFCAEDLPSLSHSTPILATAQGAFGQGSAPSTRQ